jgi:hypothetical protein
MTAATVITSILEYKESTVTTSSTIYNTDASSKLWSEIPGSLISGLFPSTVLTNQTAVTTGWGDQVVTAPTPYVTVGIVLYAPGSMVTESGTSSCKPADLGGPPYDYWSILDPPYVFIPTPTTQFRGPAMVTAPSGILDAWIDQEPTITEKYPLLPSCSPVSGTGEPVIHIPVSGVTEHSTTTIRKE